MLTRIRKAMDEREEGFTLIELLVVIIIIGILAAIAIPVFLNQRQKGYDAAAKSDVKNIATLQETFLTENDEYAPDLGTLDAQTPVNTSPNTSGHVTVGVDADSFAVQVDSASGSSFCWDSTGVAGQGVFSC